MGYTPQEAPEDTGLTKEWGTYKEVVLGALRNSMTHFHFMVMRCGLETALQVSTEKAGP